MFGLGMEYLWLALFVVLILLEISTMGLTSVWFAFGALIAMFATMLGAGFYLQLALFVIPSALLLIFTRPIAVQFVNKKTVKTNVNSLIGQIALVTAPVDNLQASGAATINGVEWTARSADINQKFDVGQLVRIKEINGAKLIVEINN